MHSDAALSRALCIVCSPALALLSAFRNSDVEDEVLLRENPGRFVLFPIKYDRIWEMYKKHQAAFWQASEIDLAHDAKDWEKLSDDERHCQWLCAAAFALGSLVTPR